jgi:hypothetical protein
MYFPGNVAAFGVAVFVIGLLCTALKMDRGAYRHAGFTLAIVMLVPRAGHLWVIAMHRFFEVSINSSLINAVHCSQIHDQRASSSSCLCRSPGSFRLFYPYSMEAAFEFQRYLFQPVEQRDSKHCFFQSGVAANTREDFGRALLLDRPGLNDPKFLHPELYGRPVHP